MSEHWELSGPRIGKKNRGATPVLHLTPKVRLVFYPGEEVRGTTVCGHIYVKVGGKVVKKYDACGGPNLDPDEDKRNKLHKIGRTEAGTYVLGPKQHYVTLNWEFSSIPWDAAIRKDPASDEIEYNPGNGWKRATGPGGPMFKAVFRRMYNEKKDGDPPPTMEAANRIARINFDEVPNPDAPTGKLVSVWYRNDFGPWAFKMKVEAGKHDPGYFVHTTPQDEFATGGDPRSVQLVNSHGCIHIRPIDRDEMVDRGYLARGVVLEVKGYSEKGPRF